MQTIPNNEIRKMIDDAGLKYWQVAEQAGVTAGTLTVWLRTPLTDERRSRLEKAVKELQGA